jgi:hypothetical protein
MTSEHTSTFSITGSPCPAGGFDILAITAGEGNGWRFSAETLRASLPLWDGAACFVDHAGLQRSVRDLAGLCSSPAWDDAAQGIRLQLEPSGPSAALLEGLGRELLSGEPRPQVGFSADLVFTAQGQRVQTILKVLSVDLVIHPARGGKFLRARQSTLPPQGHPMNVTPQPLDPSDLPAAPEPQRAALAAQPPAGTPLADALCAHLLEAALRDARLPSASAAAVRRTFAGRAFTPAELDQAIADQRALVGELSARGAVTGLPGGPRVGGMFDSGDQIRAALHDLLGAPRPEGLESARPTPLSGIRELYTLLTGDRAFAGGYYPEHVQFATTASLPGLLKNALNKVVFAQWQELGKAGYRWWEPVVTVEHFNSLQEITGVLVGEVATLPAVDEGAAYPALKVSDSAEIGAWGKYGGYVGLTLEMFERDETHKLRAYPRKLASAALRRISALVGAVFTAASGVGPTMADGKPVFHADHANLGTAAFSSDAWEAAGQAIYSQPMLEADGTGPLLALDAKYVIVPRAKRLAAAQVLYPSFAHEANIFAENLQRGELGDVIACPEFTDADNWAAVADPRLAPGIIVGERFGLLPEIILADGEGHGALFTHDEIRMKVRHWVSVFVADHRPLYKSNVG